jgi:hypothetical protein
MLVQAIRLAALLSLAIAGAACGDDDGEGNQCPEQAQMTGSPMAQPLSAAAGDTITIEVPVDPVATRVRVQLLSDVDGQDHGDGSAPANAAESVQVKVEIFAGAPVGGLFPFVEVYECGRTNLSTQYVPDLVTGEYSWIRSDSTSDPLSTSFTAPKISVQ